MVLTARIYRMVRKISSLNGNLKVNVTFMFFLSYVKIYSSNNCSIRIATLIGETHNACLIENLLRNEQRNTQLMYV